MTEDWKVQLELIPCYFDCIYLVENEYLPKMMNREVLKSNMWVLMGHERTGWEGDLEIEEDGR